MFKNVLVGVDGNEGGRDAIALAHHLAGPAGRLTLGYVHVGGATRSPTWHAVSGKTEDEQALELLERQRTDAAPEASVRTVGSRSVGQGLHLLAESLGADLLIVGSSRRGLWGRVMIGDDTRAALNGAPCAVGIAPAGYAREKLLFREIGVAYNESPEAEHALVVGERLAAETGAKLSAFEAVSLPIYHFYGGPEGLQETIDQLVDGARQRIAAHGGVEPHAAYGIAVEELTLYSASVDLLIVGSRGYGPLGRLVHGSTSQALARTARCPLLILARAARASALGLDAPGDAVASVEVRR